MSALGNGLAQQDDPGFVKTPLASRTQIRLSRCMPFAHHVFRHTPALRGLITPPDASEMRFGQDRFAELDAQAQVEGWPSGWRMEHEAREANRQTVLSGRIAQDLWVFAYGSLIWDPAVQVEEYRYGSLSGWHRSFCMQIEGGRGSHEQPGLMAALDEGGHCDGVVFRIPAALINQETEYMWRREMFSGSYRPVFLEIATPQGSVDALVFVMDRDNRRYMPDLRFRYCRKMKPARLNTSCNKSFRRQSEFWKHGNCPPFRRTH